MIRKRKIKVLIVEDSLLFRETLRKELAQDLGIEVVAVASDPYMARDKIIEFTPDVITLDIELPRMNGIKFLKKLMPQYPIPVVAISAIEENIFEALDAGAVDFVTKPNYKNGTNIDNFINELIIKIKIASTANVSHWKKNLFSNKGNETLAKIKGGCRIIAIGASTGGTEATYEVLKRFPKNMPGIVITQHMPANFTRMYAERLNRSCLMEVKEAENGDEIVRGRVLIAPGDKHMSVKRRGNMYIVECFNGKKVNGHRPSVDVLFNSMAKEVGKNGMGVILTGMGYDGAKGLLNMKKTGAITIGQDEKSCVVYGMPKVAYEIGAVERQVSIEDIAGIVHNMVS